MPVQDKAVGKLIARETQRQGETINLIASENYASRDVLETLGSVFTNKYAEGYSRLRYYGGNEVVDELEELVGERALALFDLDPKRWSVNAQPYSGSPANLAVYLALVPTGEKIMGMRLEAGGHLTHGHKVSVTGQLWRQVPYGVDPKTEELNYAAIERIAKQGQPKLIVAGYTAYSRAIDFKRFREIANAVGAILMVDMSHVAGLVAGRAYPSPFPYADVVTTTTHKTLRGPRSALIFSRGQMSEKVDRIVFPGLQGGPHVNQIAAVAVALGEAKRPAFRRYARQVVRNARVLARALQRLGWRIVSGGTDSHLFLMDTWAQRVSGKTASDLLESVGIVVNKNTIPLDTRPPQDPSGIRIGTPAVTTRGMAEKEMLAIAGLVSSTLRRELFDKTREAVHRLTKKFPLPY